MNSLLAKQDSNQILSNDAKSDSDKPKKRSIFTVRPIWLVLSLYTPKTHRLYMQKTNNKSVQKPHLMSLVSERFVRCKTTATVRL